MQVALVTTIVLGALFVMLVRTIDQREFIHVYTYSIVPVTQSGIRVEVDFQPLNAVRREIPERVAGPPYAVTLRVKCERRLQSVILKRLVVERSDGSSEICYVEFAGGQPNNSLVVASSRIT